MKTSEAVELCRKAIRLERLGYSTEQSYCGWVARFCEWCKKASEADNDSRVSGFLSAHAEHWSASTQNQCLNALVFFFGKALQKPLGKLPDWTRAQHPRRLPEWVSDSEARAVLSLLRDEPFLGCALMYGSGLRVNECARLRWRDIDYQQGAITVRGGKGDKDRVTCLPSSLLADITAQRTRAEALWKQDRARGLPGVQVPDAVGRKQPRAGETFGMFWVFPAAGLSTDPRSGIRRRHHLHADTFAKALSAAARRAGIQRRITPHSLRHSFATAYLLNGGAIHELQDLLGHASIATTSVYLHCLPQLGARVRSPLDAVPSKVVPFAPSVAYPQIAEA